MGRIIVLMVIALSIAMPAPGIIVHQVEAGETSSSRNICVRWGSVLEAVNAAALQLGLRIPWVHEPEPETLTLYVPEMEARIVYHFTAGCLARTETLPLTGAAAPLLPRGTPA